MAVADQVSERDLLHELEPEAERLLDRHTRVAEEWFPHDYVPYSLGRDYTSEAGGGDFEPWTPDHPSLTGVARTALEVNLLTEDNLPSYHREIHGMFGKADSAWMDWIHRWTAEEGRHAIVLRDYLVVTRNVDPVKLERNRMAVMSEGYDHHARDTLHGMVYVAFQELATRISHRNTGTFSDDPVADRIMARIAADENLHMVFYRDMVSAAMHVDASATVMAIADEVIGFEMPGAGMPNFRRSSAIIADAGIYDPRNHHDDVVWPLLKKWKVFRQDGLSPEAEARRDELADFLDDMDATASRFEDKREARRERREKRERRLVG
jgi:acyl-[acyl-carrier-protein] desaturase